MNCLLCGKHLAKDGWESTHSFCLDCKRAQPICPQCGEKGHHFLIVDAHPDGGYYTCADPKAAEPVESEFEDEFDDDICTPDELTINRLASEARANQKRIADLQRIEVQLEDIKRLLGVIAEQTAYRSRWRS